MVVDNSAVRISSHPAKISMGSLRVWEMELKGHRAPSVVNKVSVLCSGMVCCCPLTVYDQISPQVNRASWMGLPDKREWFVLFCFTNNFLV